MQQAPIHRTHWINGKPWTGEAAVRGDIYNPATGRVSGTVDFATAAEVAAAVAAAAAALPGWRETSLVKRGGGHVRLPRACPRAAGGPGRADHRRARQGGLGRAGEVARGLEVVEFACGIPHLLKGGFSENARPAWTPTPSASRSAWCAGITPFNFPAMVPMWMFPIALACGNTFVLKPSEKDPSASLLLAELLPRPGCPDGAFNVVHGDKPAVDALLTTRTSGP